MNPTTLNDITPVQLSMLIGIVIPIIHSLITKWHASGAVKAGVNLALTAVAGATATLVAPDGHSFAWVTFVYAVIGAFLTSVASYYGFFKSTGISDKLNALFATFGFGSNKVPAALVPATVTEAAILGSDPNASQDA